MALVAIQKCLVLLHDYFGPNTKKLWLHTHTELEATNPFKDCGSYSVLERVASLLWAKAFL